MFRIALTALVLSPLSLHAAAAEAHHGWAWTTGKNIEIAGRVTETRLGNPHGVLTVDVKGQAWTVEVGQPWRNERAGLKDAMLVKGVELTIHGHRAKDPKLKVVKANRVVIKGQTYNLYPDRS